MTDQNKSKLDIKDAVQTLQNLIGIDSVKGDAAPGAPFGQNIRKALDAVFTAARRLGFDPVDVDGYAGYCEIAGTDGRETVGVLTHLDVVPIGGGWTHRQGELNRHVLYGRGAADDKGPAIACLYALKRLVDSGCRPKRNIRLIWGCDEESGSRCMAYYAKKVGMPTLGFTPDSDFPIVCFEKTILQICAEISLPKTVAAWTAGTRPNVVPDRSECVSAVPLSGFSPYGKLYRRIDRGRSAHAMAPDEGDSAVWKTAAVLSSAISDVTPFKKLLSLGSSHAIDDLGLTVASDPTGTQTVNIGVIETVGRRINVTFDFRCPKSQSPDRVVSALKEYLGAPVRVLSLSPYLYVDQNSELFKKLYRVWKETARGDDTPPLISGGGTYARTMPIGVGFGPYLPDTDNRIHDADEFIGLDHFAFLIGIYENAMRALSE